MSDDRPQSEYVTQTTDEIHKHHQLDHIFGSEIPQVMLELELRQTKLLEKIAALLEDISDAEGLR